MKCAPVTGATLCLSFGFQTSHSLSDPGQAAVPSRDLSILLNDTLKCFPLLSITKRIFFPPQKAPCSHRLLIPGKQRYNPEAATALSSLGGMGPNIPHHPPMSPTLPRGTASPSSLPPAANVNLKPRGGKLQDAVITTGPIEENKSHLCIINSFSRIVSVLPPRHPI